MSTTNLYEFQIFKQLEMLSRYNWKFQLHLSPLFISSLSISPILLSLFALSHLFHVYLTCSFSVCCPDSKFPSFCLYLLWPFFLSVSSVLTTLHLIPFLSLSPTISPALLSCLPTQHTAQNFIHSWSSITVCWVMLMRTFTFYKNDHQFCVLRSKEDHELSGQVVDLTELVLV